MINSFFKPITIAGQDFWDGGLAFPSPIELAMWEATRIWTESTVHDVTISLGTGEIVKDDSTVTRASHSIQRLWSSFMDFLDSHTRARDVRNGLGQEQRRDFFRLDTQLPFPIRLDDVRHLEFQKQQIYLNPKHQLVNMATALLVSNFFFKLDAPVNYQNGFYHCQGVIRCRTNAEHAILALNSLHTSKMEFFIETDTIGMCEPGDICNVCSRYEKRVAFYIRHPDDHLTISLRIGQSVLRKISGFPQTIRWFEVQQGFHCPFGTAEYDYNGCLSCSSCGKSSKRKLDQARDIQDSKRVKI
jgi:hypothetical protein